MTQMLQHSGTCDSVGGTDSVGDCSVEPRELTYRGARAIMRTHDRHFGCRQWVAAAAYLSAGLDDE
ncbi:hypothetical protein [Nocardia sp. NPDC051570]|uniref:hypothetical protein n=1 Tax=Nocardia sp. NPDC051570 TaxID=3364324 RepID=UPI0037A403A1